MKGLFNFNIEELGERKLESPIKLSTTYGDFVANYVRDDDFIRYNIDLYGNVLEEQAEAYKKNNIEKAGPREKIYFNPKHVNAGIITCGGLCPGINDVIRATVRCLWNHYGVRRISGIRFGFKGLLPGYEFDTIDLDPELVDDIHKNGGSYLGTSRGGGTRVIEIADAVEALNMNMLFIIGGDGTQRGALEVAEELEKRKLKIAVVGIPKTVDNDLLFIDRSFGFETAVEHATASVSAAHMEAHSHINGIGLIKLMGRQSGFIATATALASHEANFCLIPEVPFELEGTAGFLNSLKLRILNRQHAVVIIAEGAGQELVQATNKKDASGNIRLADIGVFLRDQITEYFAKEKIHINLKYID
ncbi:MAG TPA: ATP-dependent 6-phosphofructokinase, partial [Treponemataceae bacterium]|nr:ATP-dependent 6-phosphofructokinase [Treponemataceae bacterium]